jgi:hypothetical protein
MLKMTYKILLSFVLLVASANAKIIETPHFKEVLDHIKPGALLIVDIDDTLLIPQQTLGTDVWFIYRHKFYLDCGLSQKEALDKALAEWEGVRHLTKIKIVEEGSDEIIRALQCKKVPIIGLTTQGLALATRTVEQLLSLSIDLSQTALTDHDLYFDNGEHGVLFRKGILFTSGTKKGKALQILLKETGFQPQVIVFINDKFSHLKDLEEGAEALGIEFVGLRYSHEDSRVNSFDKAIADIQWTRSSFNHILSDDEAFKIKCAGPADR